jgi:FkbM family methyltransferase
MTNHIDYFQIGAHIGRTHNDPIFFEEIKNKSLVLIEPVPFLFTSLKHNYNDKLIDNHIEFLNIAISNKDGYIDMIAPSPDNDFSNYPFFLNQMSSTTDKYIQDYNFAQRFPDFKFETINVPCKRFNTIITEHSITSIDYLIMDTEGHDFTILMDIDFDIIKPNKILFEDKYVDDDGTSTNYDILVSHLKSYGYSIYKKSDDDTLAILSTHDIQIPTEHILLNNKPYFTSQFQSCFHQKYSNLNIYPDVGRLERLVGLLNDLTEHTPNTSLLVYGWQYGGFVPLNCLDSYQYVYVYCDTDPYLPDNTPNNLFINVPFDTLPTPHSIFIHDTPDTPIHNISIFSDSYVLSSSSFLSSLHSTFPLHNTCFTLFVPFSKSSLFHTDFHFYFDTDNNFKYDNLIHLCIMVKNAGPTFEYVLTENLPIIDRWTILDTGSTDDTQDIVRRVLSHKKGNLYEEPFINFRDSRNRCLDLAGTRCKYVLMLDDTYIIKGDLRTFLDTIRGDQYASSFSFLVQTDDCEYFSNRLLISHNHLRYIYTIHEVIQSENNKTNVIIPKEDAYIYDHISPYMQTRTLERKQYDLTLLHEMVRDDPSNPRHYYYLAQTYNLLEDYNNAMFWFKKRATTPLSGFDAEKFDSWFEYARILNFKLNKPWEECLYAYEQAINTDSSRPEPFYFIGIHHYLNNNKQLAFDYFKKAFILGYPIHSQMSLKPTLSFHFLPKFLSELCFLFKHWQLGYDSSSLFLQHNTPQDDSYITMVSWLNIFSLLLKIPQPLPSRTHSNKPILVFVADGNWHPWKGSDILSSGVGGSETYIIELSRWIQDTGIFDCFVFCNCSQPELFNGVRYLSLDDYPSFIFSHTIHSIIISRYTKYIPLSIESNPQRIYLVLHDTTPIDNIIPIHPMLKNILCLTDWHSSLFLQSFPQFSHNTQSFYYGIDTSTFVPSQKIKHSFIYSSFPNRGLLPLLQMWPKIKYHLPDATLHIYSDIHATWVNTVSKDHMQQIKDILSSNLDGVFLHGWVSKQELARAWSTADIWLYPCIFQETFCLTALEAAATKTLAIAPPLAALNETIGDRGILVPGNPLDSSWQDTAIDSLLSILSSSDTKQSLLDTNYNWAIQSSWKQRALDFIDSFLPHTPLIDDCGMKN